MSGKPRNLYPYKGRMISATQATALPNCEVKKGTVFQRLAKGMSVEDAIKRTREVDLVEYNGKKMSVPELCRLPEAVVTPFIFRQRRARGWPIEEALTISKREWVPKYDQELNDPPPGDPEKIKAVIAIDDHKPLTETERLQLIFQTPVNPRKCRYHGGVA